MKITIARVKGIDKAIKVLNKRISKIEGVTIRGLIRAGLIVRRDSMLRSPVRTGNLRASCYVVAPSGKIQAGQNPMFKNTPIKKDLAAILKKNHGVITSKVGMWVKLQQTKKRLTVAIGHSAYYAIYVHENPTAGAIGYVPERDDFLPAYLAHSKVGEPKFLEKAVKNNIKRIVDVIKKEAKKKK